MPFRFRYGGYTSPPDCVRLTGATVAMTSARGFRNLENRSYTFQGEFQGDSNTVAAAVAALENAMRQDGLDGGLEYSSDGTSWSETPHFVRSAGSYDGTHITNISYPDDPMAFATQRSFTVTLEAAYFSIESKLIVEYSEVVQIFGTGGPRVVLTELQDGPVDKQTVNQHTIVRATQSGRVVNRNSYLVATPPLFPDDQIEIGDARSITLQSPTRVRDVYNNYVTQWSYQFQFQTHPGLVLPTITHASDT